MAIDIYALTDHAIMVQIGQKIKQVRVAKNLSQKALAESCGLSTFSISQMENGHNTSLLSLLMVLRALRRLDVLDVLFEEEPISPVALSRHMKQHPRRQRAYPIQGQPETSDASDFNWDE